MRKAFRSFDEEGAAKGAVALLICSSLLQVVWVIGVMVCLLMLGIGRLVSGAVSSPTTLWCRMQGVECFGDGSARQCKCRAFRFP